MSKRTDRRQIAEALRRTNERLETILRISQAVISSWELGDLLQAIVNGATQVSGLRSAAIYLLEGHCVRLMATVPPLPRKFPERFRIASLEHHPHVQQAIVNSQPVIMPDLQTAKLTPEEREIVQLRRLRSNLMLPIRHGDVALGVLIVSSVDDPYRFDDEIVQLLQGFADQAAHAIEHARQYQELTEHAARLQLQSLVLNQTEDRVTVTDLDGVITYVNDAEANALGYAREDLIGANTEIYGEDTVRGATQQEILETTLQEGAWRGEVINRTRDGEERILDCRTQVVRDEQGNRIAIYGISTDITERKRTEQALRESEERFRSLYMNAALGLYRTTPQGQIVMANPALVRMLGYTSSEELAQRDLTQSGYEPGYARAKFEQRLHQDGEIRDLESAWVRKDGTTLRVRETARLIRDADGSPLYYDGTVEDVTELAEARASESQQEHLLRIAGRMASLGGWSVDLAKQRVIWSDQVAAIHEMPAGHSPTVEEGIAFYAPEYRSRIRRAFTACAEQGIPFDEEMELITRTGRRVWIHISGEPIRDQTSAVIAVQGALQDISEKRQAAADLQTSETRFRALFEGTLMSLAAMTEFRDPYTAGHQERVAELACAMADKMGVSSEQTEPLRLAALLHDIGKIAVPTEILNRPTELSELEFSIIKTHSQTGHSILVGIPFDQPVAEIVLQHHERIDGSGYPHGLRGDEMLQQARILAVADVMEAMASHRPYRPALGVDAALEEILTHRGKLYDAAAVDACVALFAEGFAFTRTEDPYVLPGSAEERG